MPSIFPSSTTGKELKSCFSNNASSSRSVTSRVTIVTWRVMYWAAVHWRNRYISPSASLLTRGSVVAWRDHFSILRRRQCENRQQTGLSANKSRVTGRYGSRHDQDRLGRPRLACHHIGLKTHDRSPFHAPAARPDRGAKLLSSL